MTAKGGNLVLLIKNGNIITDDKIIEGKNLIINEGKICAITDDAPDIPDVIDAKGLFVSPGFIDIHIHGAGGYDVMDGSVEAINGISKIIAEHGTTSFFPTTMTTSVDDIKHAVQAVKEAIKLNRNTANIMGMHLEGPFINPVFKGAQEERFIVKPSIKLLSYILDDDFSILKRITIAPEIEGSHELIKFLVGHGIVVSAGHSNGTYDEIMDAIGMGVTHSTHLYNAMRALNHREPGVVGAIFDSSITTEFIADGIHIHFAAIRVAISIKGYKSCALITDAMRACCMKDGVYSLGGQEVFVKENAARLKGGTLAGSTLTLDRAVRNVLKNTSLNIAEAVSMATSVPAKIMGIDNRKGYIKQGHDADIIIFDNGINIKNAIIGGKVIM